MIGMLWDWWWKKRQERIRVRATVVATMQWTDNGATRFLGVVAVPTTVRGTTRRMAAVTATVYCARKETRILAWEPKVVEYGMDNRILVELAEFQAVGEVH